MRQQRMTWQYLAAVSWLVFTVALAVWWLIFGLSQARHLGALEGEGAQLARVTRMLVLEGVILVVMLVAGGVALADAVVDACAVRAKPIVLTGLAAMLGAFFSLDALPWPPATTMRYWRPSAPRWVDGGAWPPAGSRARQSSSPVFRS